MAGANGNNGHTDVSIEAIRKLPTIEELKRAYEEGIPQQLLSGIEVVMRPVQPDGLLMSDFDLPDPLTQMVMQMLFPAPKPEADADTFPDERDDVDEFLTRPRTKKDEIAGFVRSVNAVCELALVDPSVLPYLSLPDRMWIFKLAFMPAAVLSRFRLRAKEDVADVVEGDEVQQAAK